MRKQKALCKTKSQDGSVVYLIKVAKWLLFILTDIDRVFLTFYWLCSVYLQYLKKVRRACSFTYSSTRINYVWIYKLTIIKHVIAINMQRFNKKTLDLRLHILKSFIIKL